MKLPMLMRVLCVASGGRDRRGGPVLTFPSRSNHDRIRSDDLRRLIAYLAGIPRLHFHHLCSVFVCCASLLGVIPNERGESALQNKQPERAADSARRHVRESRRTRDAE